jgi:hypothetical protein
MLVGHSCRLRAAERFVNIGRVLFRQQDGHEII